MAGRFYLISSKDGWKSQAEMKWDSGRYRYSGPLTVPGHEFQVLRDGSWDAAIYPSVPRADPFTAHALRGPGKNEQGHAWAIAPGPADDVQEVVLSCPRGTPLSISWSTKGERLPDTNPSRDMMPAEDRYGQSKIFNQTFGNWRLSRELGRGKQRGAVFLAARAGREAALKFPLPVRELQHLAALAGVPGVPEILDYGHSPDGGVFHVTPLLGASLTKILERQDRCGLGGRISWPAAQGLGKKLLATLKGIHARGVLHCDLSPGNVLLGGGGAQPFLIDFGLSRAVGNAACAYGNGTYEYSSIRAGLPGERAPADDLESLGWLLWHCVIGPVPWRCTPTQIDWSDPAARQQVSERISKSKQHLLQGGFDIFGSRYAYCPPQLQEFLRCARGLSDKTEVTEDDYAQLASFLDGPDADQCWADATRDPKVDVYKTVGEGVFWRPPGEPSSLRAELLPTSPGQRVVTSARTQLLDGGRWAEVEPIWMPGLPAELCQRCWILLADWGGQRMHRARDGDSNDADGVDDDAEAAQSGGAGAAGVADTAAALEAVERRVAERRRRRQEKNAAGEASDGEGEASDGAERELRAAAETASRRFLSSRQVNQLDADIR